MISKEPKRNIVSYKLDKQGRTYSKLLNVLSECRKHGNTKNKAGGSIM
jgi:hypothetical protein